MTTLLISSTITRRLTCVLAAFLTGSAFMIAAIGPVDAMAYVVPTTVTAPATA